MLIWWCLSFSATCGFKLHPQWVSHADAANCGICRCCSLLHLQIQKVYYPLDELIRNYLSLFLVKTLHSCSAISLSLGKSLGSMLRLRTVMRRSQKWSVQLVRTTTCPRSSSVNFPLQKNSWKRSWRPEAEVHWLHIFCLLCVLLVFSILYFNQWWMTDNDIFLK